MKKQVFINNFQKGTQQNANLGIGACVGFDVYSKPGVAILGKAFINSGFDQNAYGYPTYMEIAGAGGELWVQTSTGVLLFSSNLGNTFTQANITGTPGSGSGNGLVYYEGWLFAFFDTKIFYYKVSTGSHTFTEFIPTVTGAITLIDKGTSPINGNHFPFIRPDNYGFYFANGNAIGYIAQVFTPGTNAPVTFDPSGTQNSNYIYNGTIFNLPNSEYQINVLSFLPPNNLAMGTDPIQYGQGGDIVTWDTVTPNTFDYPLRIFSNSNVGFGGIKQLINRNNVLYAVTGGNHSMYATNGGTFNIINDFSVISNIRNPLGHEYPLPIFYNSFPSAALVFGNKILSGTATSTNNFYYPGQSTGIFPTGVWSTFFNNDGSILQQMEYVVNFNGGATSTWFQTGDFSYITALKTLSNGTLLVGFSNKLNGGQINGLYSFSPYTYITDLNNTSLESELFEIGTALVPSTPEKIEINLIKNLLTGQTIEISYRTAIDQNWTIIQTFIGDGTINYYSIQQHPIGATQYLQLRVRMATNMANSGDTPELRTIVIS